MSSRLQLSVTESTSEDNAGGRNAVMSQTAKYDSQGDSEDCPFPAAAAVIETFEQCVPDEVVSELECPHAYGNGSSCLRYEMERVAR